MKTIVILATICFFSLLSATSQISATSHTSPIRAEEINRAKEAMYFPETLPFSEWQKVDGGKYKGNLWGLEAFASCKIDSASKFVIFTVKKKYPSQEEAVKICKEIMYHKAIAVISYTRDYGTADAVIGDNHISIKNKDNLKIHANLYVKDTTFSMRLTLPTEHRNYKEQGFFQQLGYFCGEK